MTLRIEEKKAILLAIVIPCYNEEPVLEKAASVLLRLK